MPDIIEYQLTENDKIIIIASDGIWEFIENKEAIKLLIPFYLNGDVEGGC